MTEKGDFKQTSVIPAEIDLLNETFDELHADSNAEDNGENGKTCGHSQGDLRLYCSSKSGVIGSNHFTISLVE